MSDSTNIPDFEIIELGSEHAEECLLMRDEIFKELKLAGEPQKYLADETDEEFRAFFASDDSWAVGSLRISDGKLAACAVASFRSEPIARFTGLLPRDAFDSVFSTAYFELAQVCLDARGNGLQYRMAQALEERVKAKGARYITAIVSPENEASLKNLLKLGFRKVGEFTHEPTGFRRLLVAKHLN